MSKKPKGTTLIEVLIACGVFSLLAICLFAIIKFSLRNWKSVEDRVSIQTEIRKIQTNLSEELRRTSYKSIMIYNSDYRHTLAFENYMKDGVFQTDDDGNPDPRGYILYTLALSTGDPYNLGTSESTDSLYGTQDNTNPFKVIIRVDLTDPNTVDGTGEYASSLTSSELQSCIPRDGYQFRPTSVTKDEYLNLALDNSSYAEKYVANVYIVAKNILSFNVAMAGSDTSDTSDDYPEILVDIKCFKFMEASEFFKVTGDLDTSQYTIQVDNRIIPQNK